MRFFAASLITAVVAISIGMTINFVMGRIRRKMQRKMLRDHPEVLDGAMYDFDLWTQLVEVDPDLNSVLYKKWDDLVDGPEETV